MLEFTADVDDVTVYGLIPIVTDEGTRVTNGSKIKVRDVEGANFDAVVVFVQAYEAERGDRFPGRRVVLHVRPTGAPR